jgi:uncharacterized membrane protein YkvA (DUF1232 family)
MVAASRMKRLLQHFAALFVGIFCTIYLLNPDAGWIEFLPDVIPGIGNLDEAAAVLILLRCLAHFGVDLSFLTRFGSRGPRPEPGAPPPRREPMRGREKVIDV